MVRTLPHLEHWAAQRDVEELLHRGAQRSASRHHEADTPAKGRLGLLEDDAVHQGGCLQKGSLAVAGRTGVMMPDVVNLRPAEGIPAEGQAPSSMPHCVLISKHPCRKPGHSGKTNSADTLNAATGNRLHALGSSTLPVPTSRCLIPSRQAATTRCPIESSSHRLGSLPHPEAISPLNIDAQQIGVHSHGLKQAVHTAQHPQLEPELLRTKARSTLAAGNQSGNAEQLRSSRETTFSQKHLYH